MTALDPLAEESGACLRFPGWTKAVFHSRFPQPETSTPVALVATDFSPGSDRALRRALMLRKDESPTIVLGHVVERHRSPDGPGEARNASTTLLQLRASIRALDHVPCRSLVRHGDVTEQLSTAAQECEADLIILGPQHSRFFQELRPTLAERLVTRTGRPVLVANGVPASWYRRALIATKLDVEDQSFIEPLQDIFDCGRLDLDVLHLYDPLPQQMMARAAIPRRQIEEVRQSQYWDAQLKLSFWLEDRRVGRANFLTPALEGVPAQDIAKIAGKRACDLIVVASGPQSLVKRILVGSTVTALINGRAQDVLVVPKKSGRSQS